MILVEGTFNVLLQVAIVNVIVQLHGGGGVRVFS